MLNQYECIDLSYIESIAEGDKSIIKELITIFLDQMPEFIEDLDNSLAEKRWLNIAAIAHKAKSSVISMGMEDMGNKDLKDLELIAKELRIQEIKNKKDADRSEVQEAEQLIKNLQGYDKERQNWVKENASPENASAIINKFKAVCKKAEEELKTEIEK